MATFMPSTALIPSCWLSPDSGPWKPTLIVPPAGLPTPVPLPHWALFEPPPLPLELLLLQAARASGNTIKPVATDASRRVVDFRTCYLLEGVRGFESHPIARTLALRCVE